MCIEFVQCVNKQLDWSSRPLIVPLSSMLTCFWLMTPAVVVLWVVIAMDVEVRWCLDAFLQTSPDYYS